MTKEFAGFDPQVGKIFRKMLARLLQSVFGLALTALTVIRMDLAWSGSLSSSSPPRSVGGVVLPPFCAGPTQVQGVAAYICEVPVNWVYDDSELSQFASAQIGVTIQAVGGHGGDGGSTLGGTVGAGSGGSPGLAQTTVRGDALSGESLYIYVGNNGAFGTSGKGGNGGAATVVATQPLNPKPSDLTEILVAAGGGGGGQGYTGSTPDCFPTPVSPQNQTAVTCKGGDGGVAIAIDKQNRIGTRLSSQLPTYWYQDFISNITNGHPPFFDAGIWHGGAASSGGTAGSGAFSFAGAPGEDSSVTGTWVRETSTLKLGPVTVLGGKGKASGGAGGGGVAGGGGSGNAGGAGGASFAVGSDYGLGAGDSFELPCETQGFCAKNWLSPAGTDQPVVVITFWLNQGASAIVPEDGEAIDTDQPSLVFLGDNASDASKGIYYVLEDTASDTVNYTGLINPAATGNLLWTVPGGILEPGRNYAWYTTDQAGNQLQTSQSFTLASDTDTSGLTQGWTLYVRSIDMIDTSLPSDLQPLSNQPIPKTNTSCSCTCTQGLTSPANVLPSPPLQSPAAVESEYPSCSGFISNNVSCDCTWSATGDKPTDSQFWVWTPASGGSCSASSGSCYANAEVHLGAIDIDWASPTNALNLQVPSRLINLTSEPASPTDGTAVPSLAVPAIEGFSGSCADQSQVEVTFTTLGNGGMRFFVYADPATGVAASNPATAINDWKIPSCSWSKYKSISGSSTDFYSIDYMESQVYIDCQSPLVEKSGTQSFCLTPGTSYRVRFDAVVPYLPGPMRLGFKLPSMESSAPVPANWISTCSLDGSTQNCSTVGGALNASTGSERLFGIPGLGHLGPPLPGAIPVIINRNILTLFFRHHWLQSHHRLRTRVRPAPNRASN